MFLPQNLQKIKEGLPKDVRMIAISKTKSNSDILKAYEAGQKDFGENRVQEMHAKYKELPKDIRWHMVGHLQRNKVKYIASFVHLIHGVDSLTLLAEINKQAQKHHRIIPCLLQAKIAQEETKFGMSFSEITSLLKSDELPRMQNIKLTGLMGMASFTKDKELIRQEFRSLCKFYESLGKTVSKTLFAPSILSMGMSDDYHIAIEEGSTMIRVGSAIFGLRNYI